MGAVAGAILGGGGRALYNYANGRPLGEGVVQFAVGGAVAGATLGAATAAFGAQASVWAAPIAARGAEIEQRLGGNLPSNFPTIDKFVNGVATSIKSLDLGAKTYQSGGALLRTLNGYVDKLADFTGRTWGGTTVRGSEITQRVLQVAIPQGGMTAAQQAAFNAATARAAELGVTIQTTVIK